MEKIWKIILTGVILLAIAVPLGFIVSRNAKGRIAEFAEKGIDTALGLDSLGAVDKAKEAADLTEKTNQQITQMIEDLTSATTTTTSTSFSTSTN